MAAEDIREVTAAESSTTLLDSSGHGMARKRRCTGTGVPLTERCSVTFPMRKESPMATYFHTTDAADAIIFDGFRDGEGSYMLIGATLRGVFLADVPVDANEGAKGEDVLEVVLPDDVDLGDYEIVDESGFATYREWCVPAELINSRGRVRLLSAEEAEEGHARWLQARRNRLA